MNDAIYQMNIEEEYLNVSVVYFLHHVHPPSPSGLNMASCTLWAHFSPQGDGFLILSCLIKLSISMDL